MFRTDDQTGTVQGWRDLLPITAPIIRCSFGPLQRHDHDHAPCSTRPRWRLRSKARAGGRPPQGRHPRLRDRSRPEPRYRFQPQPQPQPQSEPRHRRLVDGPGRQPRPSASLARPAGLCGSHDGDRPPVVIGPPRPDSFQSSIRGTIGTRPSVFACPCDSAVEGPSAPCAVAARRCGPGSRVVGGTIPRDRPGRDQSKRTDRLEDAPVPRGASSSPGLRVVTEPCSSPAPVAGGGAPSLHLLGDRPPARRDLPTDRRGDAGTAPPPYVDRRHRCESIVSLFAHPRLTGVSS